MGRKLIKTLVESFWKVIYVTIFFGKFLKAELFEVFAKLEHFFVWNVIFFQVLDAL